MAGWRSRAAMLALFRLFCKTATGAFALREATEINDKARAGGGWTIRLLGNTTLFVATDLQEITIRLRKPGHCTLSVL
jgi:hypothetical protein